MAFSSDVSAGDTILAEHQNNIRKDVIDLAGGHRHDGADSRLLIPKSMANNVVSVSLADNYFAFPVGSSFVARPGASVSITIASSRVFVTVRSTWSIGGPYADNVWMRARINVDSGSSYISLGSYGRCIAYHPNSTPRFFVGGTTFVTGLSAGAHTFSLEVKGLGGACNIENNCATAVYDNDWVCEVSAMEIG
jgi:hypothetical protein